MAASSKYVQLSSSVLLEYQYADQSNLAAHQRLTSTTKLWKMQNDYTGVSYFFNDDDSEGVTGNVRDRSAVLIDQTLGRYAYLNIDGINVYNDVDDKLTDSGSLLQNPVTPDLVVYDKIILHFTQGFNFEQNEGLILEVSFTDATGDKQILTSLAYIEEDTYAQLNPAPFLFAGKQYTSYVEVEIPALYNLNQDYINDVVVGGDPDVAAYKISGIGYSQTAPLDLKFGFIDKVEVVNGNYFFESYYQTDLTLSRTDQFSSITASVAESDEGDYYELQPLSNGLNIENFINNLNNAGGDYIILHDIVLYEQLPSSGFVKTQDLQIAQIDEFDQPIVYRPIVKNGSAAVSYKIDYVARLYNRLDNTQIWKTASITNLDTKKYAKNLNKLNIGSNPIIPKVYNDVVQKTLNLTNLNSEDVALASSPGYAKYITAFIDTNNVHLSSDTVYQRVVDGETVYVARENASEDDTEIVGQGELDLDVQHVDSYHRFVIYANDKDGQKTQMDLNGVGKLKLQFFIGNKKEFEIEELPNSGANKSKGEVIFKIPATKSKELIGKDDQPLYIVAKPEDGGPETVLYQAKFTGPGVERIKRNLNAALRSVRQDKNRVQRKLRDAEQTIVKKRKSEKALKDYIKKVQVSIEEYKKRIKILEDQADNLSGESNIVTPEVPPIDDEQFTDDYLTTEQEKNDFAKVISDFKKKGKGKSRSTGKFNRPKPQSQREASVKKFNQSAKRGSNKFKR